MSDITTGTANTNLNNMNRTQIHEDVDSQRPTDTGVHSSAIGSGIKPNTNQHDIEHRSSTIGTGISSSGVNATGTGPTTGTGHGLKSNDPDHRTADSASEHNLPDPNESYPEQKHTGKVGYGPNYRTGATTGDKITGLKEEVKGKVMRKPDLVEHGHERRTGELQRKEREHDMQDDPFSKEEQAERPDMKTV